MPFTNPALAALPVSAEQAQALLTDNAQLREQVSTLQRRIEWFERQIFGQKSERRIVATDAQVQLGLEEPSANSAAKAPAPKAHTVAAHTRRVPLQAGAGEEEAGLFFDAARVPVQTIELPAPEIAGLNEDQYEIVGEKLTHHLAQRPGSYVVLKYVRPLVKLRAEQRLVCAAAPVNVLEGSRADVSFLVGMLVDKFAYHLPLYRQHQRLEQSGITVSRPWLTQCTHDAARLLEPIHAAQLASIRLSRVKTMDETPIKAARAGPGKMHTGYFWPVHGEHDEVSFLYCNSRETRHVFESLGVSPREGAVLLTDGYAAYARYAAKTGIAHAQCWAHTRRGLFEAKDIEPERATIGLDWIGKLYGLEEEIRADALSGAAKRAYRQQHAKPVVDGFFVWVNAQFEAQGLLPSNPLIKALAYARERETGLRIYLDDPEVPIDTNHLERALRPIPMGRRNWLFCWTELGAKFVGVVQSLIVTCKIHAIDPYTYLVDVLQRVGQHPAALVHELTPRLWKQRFANAPLRSRLDSN
jgi:transposase